MRLGASATVADCFSYHIYENHPMSIPSFLSPQKTYKYGCDLLSAALRTRKACHLDLRPNTVFLGELNGAWEKLSGGMVENRSRLEVAQQFHCLVDKVRILRTM